MDKYTFTKQQLYHHWKNNTKYDWDREFNELQNYKFNKSFKVGIKNELKNRYCNILPYDDNYITLPNKQYINASWVTNQYIATQGPLKHTIEDFWDMIWSNNITLIVMLTPLKEKKVKKCECYWSEDNHKYILNEHDDKNDYIVVEQEKQLNKDIIQRNLIYYKNGEKRKITQLHFIHWYDFECPHSKTFIELIYYIQNFNGPICVHCSAGVGRTGVVLTILSILNDIENNHLENYNIVKTIIDLREYRMGLVQTKEQLEFCYKIINYMIKD